MKVRNGINPMNDDCFRDLMSAICERAICDYRIGVRARARHKAKMETLEDMKIRGEKLTPVQEELLNKYTMKLIEEKNAKIFLTSQWGEALSGCDGKRLIEKLTEIEERKARERHTA